MIGEKNCLFNQESATERAKVIFEADPPKKVGRINNNAQLTDRKPKRRFKKHKKWEIVF